MGFFDGLKKLNNWSDKQKAKKEARKQRKEQVNENPTEEQLKDNKKGKLAYLWTFISIVIYVLGFGMVFAAWQENIFLGIVALLFALTLTPIAHRKAISLAQEQRKVNGKGLGVLILAYILPTILLAGGFLFFVFGGFYGAV